MRSHPNKGPSTIEMPVQKRGARRQASAAANETITNGQTRSCSFIPRIIVAPLPNRRNQALAQLAPFVRQNPRSVSDRAMLRQLTGTTETVLPRECQFFKFQLIATDTGFLLHGLTPQEVAKTFRLGGISRCVGCNGRRVGVFALTGPGPRGYRAAQRGVIKCLLDFGWLPCSPLSHSLRC
jgi:hypothetical protein